MSDRPYVEIRGAGPDVVLLHGWALHGGMWGPWLDQLASHARLHIVDLPGHGRSPWTASVADLAGLAGAVAPSIPPGAVVVGWSLGGLVALELARTRPGKIAALVLLSTTPCFLAREGWSGGMSDAVLQGFAAGLAQDYRRTIRNFLALQTWGDERASQALRALRDSLLSHGEPDQRALAAGLGILREADLRESLPLIAVPALVIAGEHDRITPATAGRELASMLPAARYIEVPKAGHAPFLSHPDEVTREVQAFLARNQPSNQASVPVPKRDLLTPVAHAAPAAVGATMDGEGAALVLDVGRVRASFSAAAEHYDAAAVLQARVRDELLARLDLLRMQPQAVLDLGAGTGHGSIALKRRYPGSRVVAADLAAGMLQEAARRQTLLRRFSRVAADASALPLRDGSLDMVFSSLMLQWCNDPDQVLRECRRVLRPGGVLTFSTLGPDTLQELRRSWHVADQGHAHVSRFIDMHDLGDALVRAGFAEPVLDVERYTLTYADARELMRDLKTIGAHNATTGRSRALTGKGTFARMLAAYETYRRDGKLPATYEVVFGQAWAPVGAGRRKPATPGGEVAVPISSIGRRRNN